MPAPHDTGEGSSSGPSTSRYPYLASLNPAQMRAVTAPPETPLQILAGPGSGKTRVLTSRVAHLVRRHGYAPFEITAVTFTNKAAAEMRKRLHVLLGAREADQLVLGTFHATCARYLRRYGGRIGLNNNFAIADADDCKKIMTRLLKARKDELGERRISLKEGAVLSDISKAKAKGETPEEMALRAARDPNAETSTLSIVAELYEQYEIQLRDAGALDFDDLLGFGLRLFTDEPGILETCRHILVDEFQDTNTTQYELMKCFAKAHGGVSVVGDPDQSIYGWRSAEIENLNKMHTDFPSVVAIHLEENYRSTGSILTASHSIVAQDPKRIPKNLYTSHPKSTPVTLKLFATPVIEASFISTEIKRLIAFSGNVLKYDDFAILLRYNALSRVIESALQKDQIPNRIIGGHKFFERMEIKDLLAYLQLADNPNFNPAFLRVVNVPKRAIGDKSIADLISAARKAKVSPMELSERIIDGDKLPAGIKPAMKKNLASFVGVVRKLRRAALKGTSVADLIRLAVEKTRYEDYLRSSQQDFDQRWENVQELISYSVMVAQEQDRQSAAGDDVVAAGGFALASTVSLVPDATVKAEVPLHPMFRGQGNGTSSRSRSASVAEDKKPTRKPRVKVTDDVVELLSSEDELDEEHTGAATPSMDGEQLTPLRFFLQASMLSTDTEANDDNAQVPRVTISTVHAAKGLEWPVVFIPAVEQGTFPSYRCTEEHEVAEERRLLYVAMTRAQLFLTLTNSQSRMTGGENNERDLSEFVAKALRKDPTTFSSELPTLDAQVRRDISTMLGRPLPDEAETKEVVMKHVRAAPPLSTWDAPERRVSGMARADEYWASKYDDYALPGQTGRGSSGSGGAPVAAFSSARTLGWPYPQPGPSKPPQSPPAKIVSANRNLPAPMPFTFETEPSRPQPSLGSFASVHSSSLAAMKALGMPEPSSSSAATGKPRPASAAFTAPSFQSAAAARTATGAAGPIPLARGTKRLGMGRPAPWGTKRTKNET